MFATNFWSVGLPGVCLSPSPRGCVVQDGFTPLHAAASGGHTLVVKILLERGASAGITTDNGFTPLSLAAKCGHDDVISALGPATKTAKALEYSDLGYGNTALLWAAQCASAASVSYLCKLGCSTGARSRVGDADGSAAGVSCHAVDGFILVVA